VARIPKNTSSKSGSIHPKLKSGKSTETAWARNCGVSRAKVEYAMYLSFSASLYLFLYLYQERMKKRKREREREAHGA
jgi:hypothetical protein